jgi:CTP:molybdopterin cytidylyltransferase MocA
LLPASLLPAIRELEGDRGARDLLAQENTLRVEAKDPGILMDWDKSEDITAKI